MTGWLRITTAAIRQLGLPLRPDAPLTVAFEFDPLSPATDRWTHLAITWSDAAQRATTYLDTSQVKTAAYVVGDAGPFAPVDEKLTASSSAFSLVEESEAGRAMRSPFRAIGARRAERRADLERDA